MSAPAGRLRAGVIGVGHLGRHHVRLLAAMPRVDLVAAVDLVGERARAAVESTTAEAHEDYRAILGRVDAVTVAPRGLPALREAAVTVAVLKALRATKTNSKID